MSIIGSTIAVVDGVSDVAPGRAAGRPRPLADGEHALESLAELDRFLASVERRALRIAELATGDLDEALDIVQDAMMGLARRYAHRPPTEWRVLFHRILDSRIRDWHRRRTVRQRLFAWLGRGEGHGDAPDGPAGNDPGPDPLDRLPEPTGRTPEHEAERAEAAAAVVAALRALPHRQRQTFLLRAWEGLDVRETARAMGCSEGSVKTHYARALQALRRALGEAP